MQTIGRAIYIGTGLPVVGAVCSGLRIGFLTTRLIQTLGQWAATPRTETTLLNKKVANVRNLSFQISVNFLNMLTLGCYIFARYVIPSYLNHR